MSILLYIFFLCFDVFSKEEEEKTMRSNIALTVILVLLAPENSADLFEVIRILLVFDTIKNKSVLSAIKTIFISILKEM